MGTSKACVRVRVWHECIVTSSFLIVHVKYKLWRFGVHFNILSADFVKSILLHVPCCTYLTMVAYCEQYLQCVPIVMSGQYGMTSHAVQIYAAAPKNMGSRSLQMVLTCMCSPDCCSLLSFCPYCEVNAVTACCSWPAPLTLNFYWAIRCCAVSPLSAWHNKRFRCFLVSAAVLFSGNCAMAANAAQDNTTASEDTPELQQPTNGELTCVVQSKTLFCFCPYHCVISVTACCCWAASSVVNSHWAIRCHAVSFLNMSSP